MVGCIVHDILSHKLNVDFIEDEVDAVLGHLPRGKSLGWDDLTNKIVSDISTF